MARIEAFRRAAGPVVVVGRPHSGSRALAGLLRAAGVFLGADLVEPQLDSRSWFQRFVVPLVTSSYFPHWHRPSGDLHRLCVRLLHDTWARYHHPAAETAVRWGWKYGESLFTIPVLRRYLPGLKVIHLVRDGRDVCLSHNGYFQLTGPLADPPGWDPPAVDRDRRPSYAVFCHAVTFRKHDRAGWHGIDLTDPVQRGRHRYLLQMQAWLTSVQTAREYGAGMAGDYREIRYEDLCTRPRDTGRELFGWLGVPLSTGALRYLDDALYRGRVGAWRSARLSLAQRRDFTDACALGAATLAEFRYPS